MSHSTNSGVALCEFPNSERQRCAKDVVRNNRLIITVFEATYSRTLVLGKMRQLRRLRGGRLLLTASAADLCYVVPDHPGRQSSAIIIKGLGILKFVTTTGPDIRCVK